MEMKKTKTVKRKAQKASRPTAHRLSIHIVKRKGHLERFDARKVYASVYAACMSCHMRHELAEDVAEKVSNEITAWIRGKKSLSSHQIFREVIKILKEYSEDASFMYETHRDLS